MVPGRFRVDNVALNSGRPELQELGVLAEAVIHSTRGLDMIYHLVNHVEQTVNGFDR